MAQFMGFTLLSLRGVGFLAYASEQAPQSSEGTGDCHASLAMTKSKGARNDKRRCAPIFTGATTKMPKIGREIKWSTKY